MSSSYYKYCIVPQCKSTTIKTPNKLFIYVPNNKQIRKKWLQLARKDNAHSLSADSRMYFCEDHFDLPNDMVNYMEYHIMGTISQVHMKPGCTPSKFECQEDRRKQTCSSTQRPYIVKKQRMVTIAECLKEREESCALISSPKDISATNSNLQAVTENVQEVLCEQTADKQKMSVPTPETAPSSIRKRPKHMQNQMTENEKKVAVNVYKYVETTLQTYPFKKDVLEITSEIMGASISTIDKLIKNYTKSGTVHNQKGKPTDQAIIDMSVKEELVDGKPVDGVEGEVLGDGWQVKEEIDIGPVVLQPPDSKYTLQPAKLDPSTGPLQAKKLGGRSGLRVQGARGGPRVRGGRGGLHVRGGRGSLRVRGGRGRCRGGLRVRGGRGHGMGVPPALEAAQEDGRNPEGRGQRQGRAVPIGRREAANKKPCTIDKFVKSESDTPSTPLANDHEYCLNYGPVGFVEYPSENSLTTTDGILNSRQYVCNTTMKTIDVMFI